MIDETGAHMLIKLLAAERALFCPNRQDDWACRSPRTKAQLQKEFRAKGIRWRAGGNANARKKAERESTELARAGLVVRFGAAGRTTHLRLTDRGRRVAETLANAPTLAEAHELVIKLLAFAPAGVLVSELLPAKLRNYSGRNYMKKLSEIQQIATAAAVAGWVESESDSQGHVAYRVTREGVSAAKLPAPPASEIPEDDEWDFYWREYQAEKKRLRLITPPDKSDIYPLPLSCAIWGEEGEVISPWTISRKPRRKTK